MKTLITCFSAALIFLSAQAQNKTIIDTVANKTCECLTASKETISSEEQAQTLFIKCIMEAALPNIEAVLKELGAKTLDESSGEKLGQAVALKLMGNCQKFIDLIVPYINDGEDKDLAEGSSEGVINKVEADGYMFVHVKETNGRINKYLWLRHFQGADELRNGSKDTNGKKVKFKWKEIEVFLPKMNEYFKMKEITSMSFL